MGWDSAATWAEIVLTRGRVPVCHVVGDSTDTDGNNLTTWSRRPAIQCAGCAGYVVGNAKSTYVRCAVLCCIVVCCVMLFIV